MALVWLVTGTSSGFGSEFVKQALSRGDKVIATARNASKIAHLKELGAVVLELDVTSPQPDLDAKAADAISAFGHIDVLVNNAAYTEFGFLEEMSDESYRKQFDTNLFGTINITRAFLPHFRARKSGIIVNIGSMAAWNTYPGVGIYSASKSALRYATDALDQEVAPLGIKTLLVEPGYFRTELLSSQHSAYTETSIPDYQDLARTVFESFRATHGKQRGDPKKGVARIIDVVRGENGAGGRKWPKELVLGADAVAVIRKKCEDTLKLLAEWEEFSSGTDVVD